MSTSKASTDLIEAYLEEQEYHGRSQRTLNAYQRVLQAYRQFLREDGQRTPIPEATRRDCMEWVHTLRGTHKPSTVATYASYVNRFYGYMVDIGRLEGNPMSVVLEQMDESIETDPVRRDVSLDGMRRFVGQIRHPLTHAVVMTFLKTGIRVGELCNLDLRDVSMQQWPPTMDRPSVRGALDGRYDALYVSSTPSKGSRTNREIRNASNKRKRDTIIPIDPELQAAMLRWLAIRPDARSAAEPLFLNTKQQWGARVEPGQIRTLVRTHAQARGWHRAGAERSENVTPHYFRHFFTTVLRDRIGDRGIVKYLRGDVADDVIETYTHNWGDRVRTRYLDHIYSLY